MEPEQEEKKDRAILKMIKNMSWFEKITSSGTLVLFAFMIKWMVSTEDVQAQQQKDIQEVKPKVENHEKILNSKMPITDYQVKQITDQVNKNTEEVSKFKQQIIANDSANKKDIRSMQHTMIDILDMTAELYRAKTGKAYHSKWEQ